jgi:hypothetical protein
VGDRQYVWTERGLAVAEANSVEVVEVADALLAPDGMRLERSLGDLLVIIIGMAGTGRVLAVFCERIAGQDLIYKILGARPMTGEGLDEWRRRLI